MINYSVNREKKTVVAYFDGGKDYWYDCLSELGEHIAQCSLVDVGPIVDSIVGNIQHFYGKAKLHPDDTWDEEIGKKVARERLIKKFNRAKDLLLDRILKKSTMYYNDVVYRVNKNRKPE